MNLKINTEHKTVVIPSNVKVSELFDALTELDLGDYTIIEEVNVPSQWDFGRTDLAGPYIMYTDLHKDL